MVRLIFILYVGTHLILAQQLTAVHADSKNQNQRRESVSPGTVGECTEPELGDNVILLEEGENQGEGVVENVLNATYFSSPEKSFIASLSGDFPLGSQTHQASYSIPYGSCDEHLSNSFGDLTLSYRFQLFNGNDWLTMASRVSVILPTGKKKMVWE